MKNFTVVFFLIFFFSFRVTAQEIDDLLDKDFDSLFGQSSVKKDETKSKPAANDASVVEIDNMLDVDFDSIFDGSFTSKDDTVTSKNNTASKPKAASSVKVIRRGITFGASYEFHGAFAPGWSLSPWDFDGTEERTWGQGVKMYSKLSINAQISEEFKVYTVITFNIPGFSFTLGDFFFDYNFANKVFVRAGKYEPAWGISDYTNLIARLPDEGPTGQAYTLKADIPLGVGGFQALILTRVNLAKNEIPEHMNELAFGGKYNVALRWFDLDMGIFLQRYVMPTRGFFSIKTTLGKTELYSEWLVAVNTHTDNAASFAADIGFDRDFFGDKLTLGGEIFYNGEKNTSFYKTGTSFSNAQEVQFSDQFHIKFNFLYRFDGKGSPRFFINMNYLTADKSAQLIPGFKFTPFNNIEVYFAVPMALGDKEGYYYLHNEDFLDRSGKLNRPFSITTLVKIKGSVFTSNFN